jgi:hypothetical protein
LTPPGKSAQILNNSGSTLWDSSNLKHYGGVKMTHGKRIELLERPLDPIPAEHAGVPLRLRVALRRGRLTREIAMGCDPVASPERKLRSKQLCRPTSRRRAADALRTAVAELDRPRRVISPAVPVSRAAVAECREGLLGLAHALEFAQPVNPCGVARAFELVTDGAGPLYSGASGDSLGRKLWWISDGLHTPMDHDA